MPCLVCVGHINRTCHFFQQSECCVRGREHLESNRELLQWRRRRRGRRLVKNWFIFYFRISLLCRSVQYANWSETLLKLNMKWKPSNSKAALEISHYGSRSLRYVGLGHFTLLFSRRLSSRINPLFWFTLIWVILDHWPHQVTSKECTLRLLHGKSFDNRVFSSHEWSIY